MVKFHCGGNILEYFSCLTKYLNYEHRFPFILFKCSIDISKLKFLLKVISKLKFSNRKYHNVFEDFTHLWPKYNNTIYFVNIYI